ncbi:urease subunit beta [Dermacoccaceae bacterium W4C1]
MSGSSSSGPGAIRVKPGTVTINAGRDRITMVIENSGDRPVQVGSHLHLPDVNPALTFDREAAHGFRLDIAAGTSVRFEPGVSREVSAVAIAGNRIVPGIALGKENGELDG